MPTTYGLDIVNTGDRKLITTQEDFSHYYVSDRTTMSSGAAAPVGLACARPSGSFSGERGVVSLKAPVSPTGGWGTNAQIPRVHTNSGTLDVITLKPFVGNFPKATSTEKIISGATNGNPVVITTTTAHGWTSGTRISISGVVGMTTLNGDDFYIIKLTDTTFELYSDINLLNEVDGRIISPYSSGGKAFVTQYGLEVYNSNGPGNQLTDKNITFSTSVGEGLFSIIATGSFGIGSGTSTDYSTGSVDWNLPSSIDPDKVYVMLQNTWFYSRVWSELGTMGAGTPYIEFNNNYWFDFSGTTKVIKIVSGTESWTTATQSAESYSGMSGFPSQPGLQWMIGIKRG